MKYEVEIIRYPDIIVVEAENEIEAKQKAKEEWYKKNNCSIWESNATLVEE